MVAGWWRELRAAVGRADALDLTRWALAAVQGVMVWTTWNLWQDRSVPPNLPLVDGLGLPGAGWLVLASLIVVVVQPRFGLPLHVLALAAALAADQHRLQPEFISIALLLVATGPWRRCATLGWATLSSLWLWAGANKAVGAEFDGVAQLVADNVGVAALRPWLVVAVPAAEIALGIAALRPHTRRWAGWGGAALHLASPWALDLDWDWPIAWWNVGLAVAAVGLLVFGLDDRAERTSIGAGLRTAMVAGLFVYPAGVYLGLVDPYLGHHLYSGSTPTAAVCTPGGACEPTALYLTGSAVKAPIPPAPRLFRQWFELTCQPGQHLEIDGLKLRGPFDRVPAAGSETVPCPRR